MPRLFSSRLPFFFVLALLPCLLSNSCASTPSTTPNPRFSRELSPAAEAAYQFLVYQDLLRQDKKEEATTALKALDKAYPDPELTVELANLQWGQNAREEATTTLERGMAAFPESRQIVFYIANAYQMRRMTDKACQVLEDFLAKHPNDPAASRELASILIDADKHQQAADLLAKLPADKRGAAGEFLLARAVAGLGKPKEAIAHLRAALDQDDTLMPAWADLALLQEQTGDFSGALDSYRKMQAQGEDSTEVRAKIVRLAIKRKAPAEALKELAAAPKDKPLLLDALSALIEAHYPKEARKVLAMLDALEPNNPDRFFYRAVLAYEGEKNPQAAMRILGQVTPDNPNYSKALAFRIQIALELEKIPEARRLVRQGREQFPDKKEFVAVDAAIEDRLGHTDKAAVILKESLQKWPEDIDLLYRYGVALEKLKRRGEARTIMEKIVAIDPKNSDALNYLGYSLAEEGRDLKKALAMITTALEREPDNPFFLDSLAWTLFKLHRPDEALSTIRRAAAHKVKDAIVWEHYGDIAAALGHTDEAGKAYRTALELGSDNPDVIRKKLETLK